MKQPDWFVVIQQWKVRGMGTNGVTLPFLVGALARKAGEAKLSSVDVDKVLGEIVARPVEGYVTEVRMCGDLGQVPVLSVARIDDKERMPLKSWLNGPTGEPALGFSEDVHGLSGFQCSSAEECRAKLTADAALQVEAGRFSRLRDEKGQWEYSPSYSSRETAYLDETIGSA